MGLLGLVAVKVLAPGYYARQDIRTPVRIAIVVLVATQALNVLFVPLMAHAGLALSIGLGALLNAAWLLIGLVRAGRFVPQAGWPLFGLRVGVSAALLALFLAWGAQHFDWLALRATPLARAGLLALMLAGASVVYFGSLMALGLRLRRLAYR